MRLVLLCPILTAYGVHLEYILEFCGTWNG